MLKSIKRLFALQMVRYAAVGGMTTLVNIVVFAALTGLSVHYLAANTAAFAAAVAFAYYANERFVFRVGTSDGSVRRKRLLQFALLRIASYAADMGLMALLVSVLSRDELLSKLAVNAIVIVVNYAASKFHIFKEEANG